MTFYKRPISIVMMLIFTLVFFGCASTVSFTPKDFCKKPVDPKMARIILTRPSLFGSTGIIEVFDNGQPIGEIAYSGQLCWDRYPGKSLTTVSLWGGYERMLHGHLKFTAEAGETYNIEVLYDLSHDDLNDALIFSFK